MLSAVRNDWDNHALTASKVFADVQKFARSKGMTDVLKNDAKFVAQVLKEIKNTFPDQRQASKTLNFGIIYGMGAGRFAESTNMSKNAAYAILDEYFYFYKGLKRGIRAIQQFARKKGYVRSLLRRYIHIPMIKSQIEAHRAAGERQAFNYVIQGSAADLLKMSMILIEQDEELRDMGVEMILQIHDELLFVMPDKPEVREVAKKKIEAYVSYPYRFFGFKDLTVETPAELTFGRTWKEAK